MSLGMRQGLESSELDAADADRALGQQCRSAAPRLLRDRRGCAWPSVATATRDVEHVVEPRRPTIAHAVSVTTKAMPGRRAQRLLAEAEARSHSVRARSKNFR